MANEIATLKPKEGNAALEGWKHSALAFKESNDRNEAAAFAFQERAVKAEARAEVAERERDAARTEGHRRGYLEARSKYGLAGALGGMVVMSVIAVGVAGFNQYRMERQAAFAVEQANESFVGGLAVGAVKAESDDAGHSRGREPASAPR